MATWAAGTFQKWSPPSDSKDKDKDKDKDKGDEEGDEGESKPGDEEGEGDEEGDTPGKGKGKSDDEEGEGEGEGEGKPSDKPGKGKGKGKPGDGQGDGDGGSESDELMKDLEKKLSKRKEINSNEEANAKDAENAAKGGKTGPEGVGNKTMSDLESRKSEVDNMRPKLNWKSLIRLMLSSSTVATNTTRTRPSRRGLTGLAAAAEMGAGAMPPGIKTDEDQHNKIALVLDTSGSMYQVIPTMLAECQKLLKTLGKAKFPITVIFFAGQAKWFQVNLSNNTYYKVNGPEDLNKPPPKDAIMKDYRVLLSKGGTGGTEFSGELVSQLVQLLGTGYNIMLFSDDNMFWPNNWPYLTQMYQSSQGRFFWICDNLRTWREACNKFGKIPKTFTHL